MLYKSLQTAQVIFLLSAILVHSVGSSLDMLTKYACCQFAINWQA